jgi:predicted permease
MPGFIVIFISLLAGILLQRSERFPEGAAKAMNSFIIVFSYPAVILLQVPHLLDATPIDRMVLIPISMAWISFALSWALFTFLGKRFGWTRATTGALILTAGLGNTSFVGFPLIEALLGPEGLRIAIINDQPGSFLVLSTLGLLTAAAHAGAKLELTSVLKRIFTFPPFIALIAAVIWWMCGTPAMELVKNPLEKFGGTLVPLALFAVGLQMRWNLPDLKSRKLELASGLGFKLFLNPLFFYILYFVVLGSDTFPSRVTLLESAMAPMITAGVVATEFGLDSRIANLMLGIGIPVSLLTVPLINHLLGPL